MSFQQSILKPTGPNPTLATCQYSQKTHPARNHTLNLKGRAINSLISTSSGTASDMIAYSGNFWDKPQQNENRFLYEDAEDSGRRSESSSSVIYEESPEILILNRHKIHGRKEQFSREFAINLQKLRVSRYSEHIPRKNMELQIEDDVQPEITTLRESIIKQRKRTESCYPRFQNSKNAHAEHAASSVMSRDSKDEEIIPDSDRILQSCEHIPEDSEPFVESITKIPKILIKGEDLSELSRRISAEQAMSKEFDTGECDECIEEMSEMEEGTVHNSNSFANNFLDAPFAERQLSAMSKSRSIDSVSVSIDGNIFTYFNKAQLCSIPAVPFMEYIERVRNTEIEVADPWRRSLLRNKLCCYKQISLPRCELEVLEKIIGLSLIEFDYTSNFHLILLLATYKCITGESDWPSCDNEWLNMGLSSTDLQKSLKNGGVVGLLFAFSLGTYFPEFIKEMLDVSRYYAFDVFEICKHFSLDAVEILREKRLHKHMHGKNKALEVLFLFYSGMLMSWFSIIVRNKDFNEVHKAVLSKAKSSPNEYIELARNKCTHFPV